MITGVSPGKDRRVRGIDQKLVSWWRPGIGGVGTHTQTCIPYLIRAKERFPSRGPFRGEQGHRVSAVVSGRGDVDKSEQ